MPVLIPALQRATLAHHGAPPDWAGAVHVTINALSAAELASVDIAATVVYNSFDPDPEPDPDAARSRRATTRRLLGLVDERPLVLQPTRAIPRKNVPAALALAEAVDAVYWLLGPAEEGYDGELADLLGAARVPVVHGWPGARGGGGRSARQAVGVARDRTVAHDGVASAYAACDLVALPSTWEGFGNPTIESAVWDRPLAVGPYPVAQELRSFGFEWFDADDYEAVAAYLRNPDPQLVAHNHEVARRHFSTAQLPDRLEDLLDRAASPTRRSSADTIALP